MYENLVIVESPAKAKTIEKFLGPDYTVKSSFGHIRDLAKKDLGIDIDNGFQPNYQISDDKKKVVSELVKATRDSRNIWLASDEDREGEAIAWHLAQVLDLPVESTRRIVFHEITKGAILEAIKNPRTIDINLVNAQQARRVLDRLVGFELSPVLWKKVRPSLSAGRVQSVAVRLVVEREKEIMAFRSSEFWKVSGQFLKEGDAQTFRAELSRKLADRSEAERFLEECRGAEWSVDDVQQKPGQRTPAAPFTTSTLQQEAGRKLSMSVAQTMSAAQKLYEAGLITYMRTDSVNLAKTAVQAARQEIVSLFGEEYAQTRTYTTKTKGAQEAHEAIRPTYMDLRTVTDRTPSEQRLYELIWKRTIASQMASARTSRTAVTLVSPTVADRLTVTGESIVFDGFMRLYTESADDEDSEKSQAIIPQLRPGERVTCSQMEAVQRFTPAPWRYSEATLVKKLEELGIGRPSTYAPTISTILQRDYVIKQNRDGEKRPYTQLTLKGSQITSRQLQETVGREKGKLCPTDIGIVVSDFLDSQFPQIMDYNFTANVEKEFDEIAEGGKQWNTMISEFYSRFHPTIESALSNQQKHVNQERVIGTDPETGRTVSARIGRYGPMVQIEAPEGEKPRYAAMKKGQLIQTITLEEALELFRMPRHLGEWEGKEVTIGIGRFGPYAKYDGAFTSLPKTEDPYSVTLERAVEIICEKREQKTRANEPMRTFPEDGEMSILNGMYGPYIKYRGKNYRIPSGTDPMQITLKECLEIVSKPQKSPVRKRTARK